MKCHVCGGLLEHIYTDLPFKLDQSSIAIIKNVPVWQCTACSEYVLEDQVMERIDTILDSLDSTIELEVKQFAA